MLLMEFCLKCYHHHHRAELIFLAVSPLAVAQRAPEISKNREPPGSHNDGNIINECLQCVTEDERH